MIIYFTVIMKRFRFKVMTVFISRYYICFKAIDLERYWPSNLSDYWLCVHPCLLPELISFQEASSEHLKQGCRPAGARILSRNCMGGLLYASICYIFWAHSCDLVFCKKKVGMTDWVILNLCNLHGIFWLDNHQVSAGNLLMAFRIIYYIRSKVHFQEYKQVEYDNQDFVEFWVIEYEREAREAASKVLLRNKIHKFVNVTCTGIHNHDSSISCWYIG